MQNIYQIKSNFSLNNTPEEGNSASVKNPSWLKCGEAQTSTFDFPVSQQVKRHWSCEGAYLNIFCFLIVCLAAPSSSFNGTPEVPKIFQSTIRITLPLPEIMLLSLVSSTKTTQVFICRQVVIKK